MNTVIQIYGMSFCGSTMLDLMIGNGEGCISCGEVYALFRDRGVGREDEIPEFWKRVRSMGEEGLYFNLFKEGYNVISDSSKLYDWLELRPQETRGSNVHLHKVVLFKTPEGWVGSMLKRGNKVNMRAWVNRYQMLMKNIPEATYIEYKTLATEPKKTLQRLCRDFNISYFKDKERYWESELNHLFGNSSTRARHDLTYTEDRSHKEYNTKTSSKVYAELKKREQMWLR